MVDQLRLGTATVDITPPLGSSLAGWRYGSRRSTGIHQPLLCRALHLSFGDVTAAIVSLDLLGISADYAASIRTSIESSLGVSPEQVMLACSHTHSGPVVPPWWLPNVDRPSETYLSDLRQKIVDAVAAAARNTIPARVGHAQSKCDLAISRRLPWDDGKVGFPNRADPLGDVDSTVGVLRFDALDGTVAAVLFSYGCHPTVAGPSDWLSPDYPGAARDVVEAAYPGATAIFLLGNAGDVRTNFVLPDGRFLWNTDTALVESAGVRLGREVVTAASQIETRNAQLRLGRSTREIHCVDDSLAGRCEFLAFRVGDAVLLSNPAETFCGIGLEVREASSLPVLFSSLTNGMLGYVPTERAYAFGGYEVEVSYKSFGLSAPIRPDGHRNFREGMLEALAQTVER